MVLPDYPPAHRPGFVASSLERQGHWRERHERRNERSALLPLKHFRIPVEGTELRLLEPDECPDAVESLDGAIWLGIWNGRSLYTVDISADDPARWPALNFVDLRGSAQRLLPDQASVMAYARAMIYWQQQHQHCGVCGGPTEARQGGHVRYCLPCEKEHYPRSDPSMLVLVTDPQNRALLARQEGWPPGMWSGLAGFVEPGESIEDAVVREVWEEARVNVTAMRYHASQPWPFPASILLGFHATSQGETPQVEQDELEAADWFSRERIVRDMQNRKLWLPPSFTLSFHLIEHWFNQGPGPSLQDLIQGKA